MMNKAPQLNFHTHDGQDFHDAILRIEPRRKKTSSAIQKLHESFSNSEPLQSPTTTVKKSWKEKSSYVKKVEKPSSSKETSLGRDIKKIPSKEQTKDKVSPSTRNVRKSVPFKLDEAPHEATFAEISLSVIKIQRISRGGWQRIKFRVKLLEHKIKKSDDRRRKELREIEEKLQQRKYVFRDRLERKVMAKVNAESESTAEHRKLIAYLQKDNKQIREQNQRIYQDIAQLKYENERLEEANARTAGYMVTLKKHQTELEETNAKLMEVIPMYRTSVERMEEAIEMRREFGLAEQRVKIMYTQCIGKLVERLEERSDDEVFIEEVFQMCLDLGDLDQKASAILSPA